MSAFFGILNLGIAVYAGLFERDYAKGTFFLVLALYLLDDVRRDRERKATP